ncbi:MAG: hypothetical protein ACLKAK_07730 [Alkaliphilus sp.]
MPRQKRKMSEIGIYHVMIRGINQQMILEDTEDYYEFLKAFKIAKEKRNETSPCPRVSFFLALIFEIPLFLTNIFNDNAQNMIV